MRTRLIDLLPHQLAWLRTNNPGFKHAEDAVRASDANAEDCFTAVRGPRAVEPVNIVTLARKAGGQ